MTITTKTLTVQDRHIGKPTPKALRPQRPAKKPLRLTMLDRAWFDFNRIAGHRVA